MDKEYINKKICQGKSEWSGKPCTAKAVKDNTVRKGTKEFLDPRYCQMHQPGNITKKKCVCPMCEYHVLRRNKVVVEYIDKTDFGKSNKKKKKV